jgi:hypothetical protein
MRKKTVRCIGFIFIAIMLLCVVSYSFPINAAAKINVNVNQDTFVLSNEAPGYGISSLVSAGYSDDNLYQALVNIVSDTNPSVSSILTTSFLENLKNAPASSEIFAIHLKDVNFQGATIGVSTDSTVLANGVIMGIVNYTIPTNPDILVSTYQGTFPTLNTVVSGAGNFRIVHENTTQTVYNPQTGINQTKPVTSFTIDGPLEGMTTTYNVFGILYSPQTSSTTPTAIPSSTESQQTESTSNPQNYIYIIAAIIAVLMVVAVVMVVLKKRKPKQTS